MREKKNDVTFPVIHLIGLPGAGKTVLGRRLSKKFGVPVLYVGEYRSRFPQTAVGEADTWVALFSDLSKAKWCNCILETTGMNAREQFLKTALPLDQIITIKLTASLETLHERIRMKKKCEQGGAWLFDKDFPDKIAFVDRLYKDFEELFSFVTVDTDGLTKEQVYRKVLRELDLCPFWFEERVAE